MHVLECHSLHFPDDTVLRFITMFLLVADKKKIEQLSYHLRQ